MQLGRLALRATVGGTFFVHGSQKLFGWFGGYGPDGTGGFFDSLGLRPGKRNALLAGGTEVGGGVLLALGLATPLAASGLTAIMITALRTAVWKDGFEFGKGEFEVLLAVAALSVVEDGPGPLSLDAALGMERKGLGWALAALGAAAAGSALVIKEGQREQPAEPAAPAEQATPAEAATAGAQQG